MAREFLPYSVDQPYLLPPNPRDWLAEDHLALQVLDVVEELDLRVFNVSYGRDGRGAPAFHPRMMVALLLYAWTCKVYSSRKIAGLCRNDIGARVIGGGCFPDHRTINNFRVRHQEALNSLFQQSLNLCVRAGLVSLVEAALDGSKIAANASKRKAMSYGRMVEEELRIQAQIDGYFERATQEDAEDNARMGTEKAEIVVADEIKRRQTRLVKIREAKTAIETEAKEAAQTQRVEREKKEEAAANAGKKLGGRPPNISETPKPSSQRSFTDPESRIMKGGNGSFLQAYNAQAVVDSQCQVILACALSQNAADVMHLKEMLDQTIANVGTPQKLLADPGYFSAENIKDTEAWGVVALIPPDRERCGTPDKPAKELTDEEMTRLSATDRMRHLVSTEQGRKSYAKRKTTVEPVFGQQKGCAGHPGFLGFLRRGLEKCFAEWQWLCASHNLLKYIRFKRSGTEDARPNTVVKSTKNRNKQPEMALFAP